jgi:hypothetical protein
MAPPDSSHGRAIVLSHRYDWALARRTAHESTPTPWPESADLDPTSRPQLSIAEFVAPELAAQNSRASVSSANPHVVALGCQAPARSDSVSVPLTVPVAPDVAVIDAAVVSTTDNEPRGGDAPMNVPASVDAATYGGGTMNAMHAHAAMTAAADAAAATATAATAASVRII